MSVVSQQQQVVRLPIFCHSIIDDLPMSLEAFRMYAHLARKWGNGKFGALGSYGNMGEHCFRSSYPKASSETLRRKAIAAVAELEEIQVLHKQTRQGHDGRNLANSYILHDLGEVVSLHQGGCQRTKVVALHPPSEIAPLEDTNSEDTLLEDSLPLPPQSEQSGREEENLPEAHRGTIDFLTWLDNEPSPTVDEQTASGEGSCCAVTCSPTQISAITKSSSTPTPISQEETACHIESGCVHQLSTSFDQPSCLNTQFVESSAQTPSCPNTQLPSPAFVTKSAGQSVVSTRAMSLTADGEPRRSSKSSHSTQLPRPGHVDPLGSLSVNSQDDKPPFESLERTQLLALVSRLTQESLESLRLNTNLATALDRHPDRVQDALEYFKQALATWKNKPGIGLLISAIKSGQKPCLTKPGSGWKEWADEAIRRRLMSYSKSCGTDIMVHFVSGIQRLWSELRSLCWSEIEMIAQPCNR